MFLRCRGYENQGIDTGLHFVLISVLVSVEEEISQLELLTDIQEMAQTVKQCALLHYKIYSTDINLSNEYFV